MGLIQMQITIAEKLIPTLIQLYDTNKETVIGRLFGMPTQELACE